MEAVLIKKEKEDNNDNSSDDTGRFKRYKIYCARKKMFEEASARVGQSSVLEKVETYNKCICEAPPRLYDIYVSLYLTGNSQDSLAEYLGYSVEYISKLNSQLIRYFQTHLGKEREAQ